MNVKKISKHHSLHPLLKLEAVWWQCWGLARVSAPPCSPTAALWDRVHTSTSAFCLCTSASKTISSCEKHSLLIRGVVMAKELPAHLRNEGLQGTLDLHLTHFPMPVLLPCSQWASSGVWPKPDSTHPKTSSSASFIHIHEKSHCSEYPPHEDTPCWSLEWVCKGAQLLLMEPFLSCYFSVFPRADLSLIYWNAGRILDNHKNILFEATSPGFEAVKLDRQFCYSCAEL